MLAINSAITNNNPYSGINYRSNPKFVPAFGYRLPAVKAGTPRKIHGLICGCCGNDMLTKEESEKFLESFLAGSKRALEHSDIIEKYKSTPEYQFLSELSAIAPKKTIRELISIPENKAKIKTLDGRTQLGINYIALLSDGLTVKAPRVIQKLNKYYEHFSKDNKELLNVMTGYSEKYPKLTFSEIFRRPEVFDIHNMQAKEFQEQALAKKTAAFKKIRELFPLFSSKKDVSEFQKAHIKVVEVLNTHFYKPHIKKALVREIYDGFLKEYPQNRRITRRIHSIAAEYPYENDYVNRFIVNCVKNKKTDKSIVKNFVEELQLTFEHVVLKSKNGEDNMQNGIYLCKKCNYERSNLPYPFFLRFHPEMKVNLQKQLNKIIAFIKYGNITNYEEYPIGIKRTIWQETNHIIKLKIDKYLDFRKEKAAKRLEKTKTAFGKKDEQFKIISKSMEAIDEKIEELMVAVRKLKKQKRGIRENYDGIFAEKAQIESDIKHDELEYKYTADAVERNKKLDKKNRAKKIKKIKDV